MPQGCKPHTSYMNLKVAESSKFDIIRTCKLLHHYRHACVDRRLYIPGHGHTYRKFESPPADHCQWQLCL